MHFSPIGAAISFALKLPNIIWVAFPPASTPPLPGAGAYTLFITTMEKLETVDWFGGMTVYTTEDGETLLTGPVENQAALALHGLLKKVRDLGTTLIAVSPVEPDRRSESMK